MAAVGDRRWAPVADARENSIFLDTISMESYRKDH
jgi:hypothetical protein